MDYSLPRRIPPPCSSAASAASSKSCCFSFAAYARGVMDQLRRRGVFVAAGLTDDEFASIESQLNFVFPPELRAMLAEGLPLGGAFPDWRSAAASASGAAGSAATLRARMQQPVAGVCREVARGRFWCAKWGPRPAASDAAVRTAAAAMAAAPPLVPIHGRCYIPGLRDRIPQISGYPVLHVHGARVACVGNDLADFFDRAPFFSNPAVAVLEAGDDEIDDQEDDPAIHGSCLRSLDSLARNPEALFFFRRKSFKSSSSCSSSSSRRLIMSRSAEASPRPSVSSNSSSGAEPPRRSIDIASLRRRGGRKSKIPVPAAAAAAPPAAPPIEALLGLSMAAPPWTAKAARRVDFWSELTEECRNVGKDLEIPARSFSRTTSIERKQGGDSLNLVESSPAPALNVEKLSGASLTCSSGGLTSSCSGLTAGLTSSRWLDVYLHDMAGRLRVAGWKEDDISEMMVCKPTARDHDGQSLVNRQSVVRGLALKVGELSDSLKQAGWSVQDVAEALGSSTSASKNNNTPSWTGIFVEQQQKQQLALAS